MSEQNFGPMNDDQAMAFARKLKQFRETLEPQERATLDVMVNMIANARPVSANDVQGFDSGNPPRLPGDDYIPGYDQALPTPITGISVYDGPSYVGGYYGGYYYGGPSVFANPGVIITGYR